MKEILWRMTIFIFAMLIHLDSEGFPVQLKLKIPSGIHQISQQEGEPQLHKLLQQTLRCTSY